jgi:hypothetical protein
MKRGMLMKRFTLLFLSIMLFGSFHFSLQAKDSDDRKNLTNTLLSSVETPVRNCDLETLHTILGKWIKVKDIRAIIVLSDSISCSILYSEAIEAHAALKKNESTKDTVVSTVIRDKIHAHLEKLNERSKNNELEEFELKITRNGNEIGVLIVYFSVK